MTDANPQQRQLPEHAPPRCKNCANPVAGYAYCPACGQKSDIHVVSFRELLGELADGLFNLDSRLWRSLVPLVVAPGKLTVEYLRGRRMYYLPPFRLYLILSVLFFLVPENNFNIGNRDNVSADVNANLAEFQADLREEFDPGANGAQDPATGNQAGNASGPAKAGPNDNRTCVLEPLAQDSLLTVLVRRVCLRYAEDPQSLGSQLADNIPVMMIVGIPLVALFMHLMYVFSGRYYVEHIIFLFHTHAFFFLISLLMALSSALGQRYAFLYGAMDWLRIIGGYYIPLYIFLAMLRVYGDSKTRTFFKALFVLVGYGISIMIVGVAGVMFTALSA